MKKLCSLVICVMALLFAGCEPNAPKVETGIGVFSVVSRSSVGGIRQSIRVVKETANLNKKHFWVIGSCLVVPCFLFGSSLVFYTEYIYEVQRMRILIFVLSAQKKRIVDCAFLSMNYE